MEVIEGEIRPKSLNAADAVHSVKGASAKCGLIRSFFAEIVVEH